MLKALAIKELRESAAIIAVTALAMLWLLGSYTGWKFPWANANDVSALIPFVSSSFVPGLIFIGGAAAIGLGLKQTVWENFGNRYYSLLHRPMPRPTIFLVKITVGLSALFLLTAIPVLTYGSWAATPGTHATPFFWGMTMDAWRTCLAMPSIYLGAILSGIRPARWIGTRLLPLLGACAFTLLAFGMWFTVGWWLGLGMLAVLDFVLLRLILATAELRDY